MNSEGVLSDQERMDIIKGSVGRSLSISETQFKIREGGDVVFLVAIVDGVETRPGAMIRRDDGVIVAHTTSIEYIDQILIKISQSN